MLHHSRATAAPLLLGLTLALPACSSTGGGEMSPEEEIRRQSEAWTEAAQRGDADRLAALYAPDAVFLPPGAPEVRGREAIARLYRQQFDRFEVSVTFRTQEIVADRTLAFRRGTYRAELISRSGGDTATARDRFLEIWRRDEDGTWRIARDMWNEGAPAPEEGG